MTRTSSTSYRRTTLLLLLAPLLLALACGPGQETAETSTVDTGVAADAAVDRDDTAPAVYPDEPEIASGDQLAAATRNAPDLEETAELDERADELARRERELARREAEVARREAEQGRVARAEPPPAFEPAPRPEPAADPEPEPAGRATAGAQPAEDDEGWRTARRGPAAGGAGDAGSDSQPPPATWTTETVAAGTPFAVQLDQSVGTDASEPGDVFTARVASDVYQEGEVVIPAGSTVYGHVVAVSSPRQIGGRARLEIEFHRLEVPGAEPVSIAADFAAKGRNETARDAATIGGAAAGGAILGRILGGGSKGKRTVLGAVIGAAAGTVIASRTEGEEVVLPAGTEMELVLTDPVRVPIRR